MQEADPSLGSGLQFLLSSLRAGLALHSKLDEIDSVCNPITRNLSLVCHDAAASAAALSFGEQLCAVLNAGTEKIAFVCRLLSEMSRLSGAGGNMYGQHLAQCREHLLSMPVFSAKTLVVPMIADALRKHLEAWVTVMPDSGPGLLKIVLAITLRTTRAASFDAGPSAAMILHGLLLGVAASNPVLCDDALDIQAHSLLGGAGEHTDYCPRENGSMLQSLLSLVQSSNPLELIDVPDLLSPCSTLRSGNVSLDTYSAAALRQLLRRSVMPLFTRSEQPVYVSGHMERIAHRIRAVCAHNVILRCIASTRRLLMSRKRRLTRQFQRCRYTLKIMLDAGLLDNCPLDRAVSFMYQQLLVHLPSTTVDATTLDSKNNHLALSGAAWLPAARLLSKSELSLCPADAAGSSHMIMAHDLVAIAASSLFKEYPSTLANRGIQIAYGTYFDFQLNRALHSVLSRQCLGSYNKNEKDPMGALFLQFDMATSDLMAIVHPYLFASAERACALASDRPRSVAEILTSCQRDTAGNLSVSVEDADDDAECIPVFGFNPSSDDTQALTCNITQNPMAFPVVLNTGHVFDATAVRFWLRRNGSCPVSRNPITKVLFSKTLFELSDALLRGADAGAGLRDLHWLPPYSGDSTAVPTVPLTQQMPPIQQVPLPQPSPAWLENLGISA